RTRLDIAGLSHSGKVRRSNEDHFAIMTMRKAVEIDATNLQDSSLLDRVRRPTAHILVVADGVGGAAGGQIASGVAVRAVVEYLAEAIGCAQDFDVEREQAFLEHLSHAVERGHERLKEMFQTQGGPATTLTMVTLVWPRAYVVHVGDSRGYYLRHGRLRQFTRDQTMGDYLVDIGAVTEQHAEKAGLYNVLSSAVGGDLVPSVGVVDLADGDALLLCTDGLTKHVPDEQIASILSSGPAQTVVNTLVDAALEGGGTDNVTVVVAKAD
ncbi:MAG TPA: protein phosphatase 2C domain-containing protein, partial [Gemmatimonadaceae bacterium]|nr:protein phosphatase 2C domain-containing protein [Gemmatimonadaceae bacterium]